MKLPTERMAYGQFSSGHSRLHYEYDNTEFPNKLKVLGKICATLSEVSRSLPRTTSDPDSDNILRAWKPPEIDAIYLPTGELGFHAYAVTLRMLRFSPRWYRRSWPSIIPFKRILKEFVLLEEEGCENYDGVDVEVQPVDSQSHQSSVSNDGMDFGEVINICTGRTFFQTQERYIGLAPPDARPGKVPVSETASSAGSCKPNSFSESSSLPYIPKNAFFSCWRL